MPQNSGIECETLASRPEKVASTAVMFLLKWKESTVLSQALLENSCNLTKIAKGRNWHFIMDFSLLFRKCIASASEWLIATVEAGVVKILFINLNPKM